MKINSSIVASFVAGAVLASLPFVLSRGVVMAQGSQPLVIDPADGRSTVTDEDYVYVVYKDKIFKVHKAGLTVMMSTKLE
jgi:hypothetical protein